MVLCQQYLGDRMTEQFRHAQKRKSLLNLLDNDFLGVPKYHHQRACPEDLEYHTSLKQDAGRKSLPHKVLPFENSGS